MARGRSPHSLPSGAPLPDTASLPGRAGRVGDLDHEAILRTLPALEGADIALVALVGSRASGMADADSDYDYRGVYVAPAAEILGIGTPAEQLESTAPDACLFELRKFAGLASVSNPRALEVLFADALIQSRAGRALVAHREAFLSQRARRTYSGSIRQQLDLVIGERNARHPRRRARSIRHLYRLWEQGMALIGTGTLPITVADPEALRARESYSDERVERDVSRMIEQMARIDSPLAPEVDIERINELLIAIRLESLTA